MTTDRSADRASPTASNRASTGVNSTPKNSTNPIVCNSVRKGEITQADKDTSKAVAARDMTEKNTATEYGGPKGLEPTRYGDWEKNGRCSDF